MLSWRQLLYGYCTTCSLSENAFFAKLGLGPDWEKVVLMRFFSRDVCFVYPVNKRATANALRDVL